MTIQILHLTVAGVGFQLERVVEVFQGPLTVMATQSRGSILMMQVCLVPACLDMFPGEL